MDRAVLLWLNGLRSPAIDPLLTFLSEWGYFAFPLVMLISLLRGRDQARSIRDGWLTWFFAPFVSETILKPLIARPRPTAGAELRGLLHVLGRVPPANSFAFPSGTAVACFAGAVFIQLRWGSRYGVPAMIFATMVSLSRVIAGIHWPSDVLAGAVLGAAFGIALSRLGRWIDR
ncbi:MAG: phosphatase PAP2 family protein [Sandaracinaceae bacterium]|nr:phosphatase PAP2 family protein [Sandaracinaceae bacterium]